MAGWLKPFTKRGKELREGEEALAAGRTQEALEVFTRQGHKAGISQVAQHLLDHNNPKKAMELFRSAGDRDGLRRVVSFHAARGNFGEAQKVLAAVFEGGIPPAEFSALGDTFLQAGQIQPAERAYHAAGNQKGLRTLAERHLEKVDLSNALRLFRELGDRGRIGHIAHLHLEKGELDLAGKLFQETDNAEGVETVARRKAERAERLAAAVAEESAAETDSEFPEIPAPEADELA